MKTNEITEPESDYLPGEKMGRPECDWLPGECAIIPSTIQTEPQAD